MVPAARSVPAQVVVLIALALGLVVAPAVVGAHEEVVVERGDTLSHIAVRSGVPLADLAAENGITRPDRIRVGQVLRIPHATSATNAATVRPAAARPAAAPAASPAARATYEVQPGDTLGHVAIRHGVGVADLVEWNDIADPNRVRSGTVLVVSPGPADDPRPLLDAIRRDPDRMALLPVFDRWADANGIPRDLLMAVTWHESGWNNTAISSKGAVGIGQLMPPTSAWVASDLIGRPGLDPTIPEDNIRMSARFLGWLIGYLGSEEAAIAGYYQGPGATRAGVMYTDTVAYVASVQAHRPFFVAP